MLLILFFYFGGHFLGFLAISSLIIIIDNLIKSILGGYFLRNLLLS